MTTYPVYLRSDIAWTRKDIDADTPEQAVETARRLAEEDPDCLDLDFYELCDCPINEIEINDEHGNELAVWYDDEMHLRLAARDLLAALEQAVQALNTARRFAVPHLDTDSYKIAAICDRAIAKAKGGAP